MSKKWWVFAAIATFLIACSGRAAPAPSSVMTLPPNVTPLVTQVGGAAQPSNRLEAIRMAGVIRVGVSADYPPFEYLDTNGNRTGLDIELMEEIAGRMGILLEWVDLPFDDLVSEVRSGKIDAAISAFEYTNERAQQVDFSQPYYIAEDAFLALESFGGKIVVPEDVAQYVVGVQSGTIQDTWLNDMLVLSGKMTPDRLVRYDLAEEAVQGLKSGKVQLLMTDYIPAQRLMQQSSGLTILYHGVVTGGPVYILLPKGEAELKTAMDTIIQQLQTEGFIQDLAYRFINEAY
jgi:polar amino acid transport system substrate-binding protein